MATLLEKLLAENLPVISVSENNSISFSPDATNEQVERICSIAFQYTNPVEFERIYRLREKKLAAKTEAGLATALKTVTPAQAVQYIETNVTNLATAKSAMKIMVRMLIALRDEVWPDLSEE